MIVPALLAAVTLFLRPASAATTQPLLPDPWGAVFERFNQTNYLWPVRLLRKDRERYLGSSWKPIFVQAAGTYESFIGNYSVAIQNFDLMQAQPQSGPVSDDLFSSFVPRPAVEEILKASKGHQAVFINEAHHMPEHRAFTTSLLQGLWAQGFRYFAAEALSDYDSELERRGYPLFNVTGFYVNEPFFGDMIREAIRIGFNIVPYEHVPDCQPDPSDQTCQNLREEGQANNLYDRILKKDPGAKIVVHAGYGHIQERGINGWIPMAEYFKRRTGIDPMTIDQVGMKAHSAKHYENPAYVLAEEQWQFRKPVIFVSGDRYWVDTHLSDAYDIQVFQPRPHLDNQRPQWTRMGNFRRAWLVPAGLCGEASPCLIQAFHRHEGVSAVPVDQVEAIPFDQQALMLPNGEYFIRAVDAELQTIGQLIIRKN